MWYALSQEASLLLYSGINKYTSPTETEYKQQVKTNLMECL